MYFNTVLAILTVSFAFIVYTHTISAERIFGIKRSFLICNPCKDDDECNAEPKNCYFGETRDPCNRRVCSRGPGGRCGGPLKYLGDCGSGMYCHKDGKCHGCDMQSGICFNGI